MWSPNCILGQASKGNTKKIFLRRILLSRFLAKTLRETNLSWNSFSKVCHPELTLYYRSCHSCIKLMRITWVVRETSPLSWRKGCNGQLLYVFILQYEYYCNANLWLLFDGELITQKIFLTFIHVKQRLVYV